MQRFGRVCGSESAPSEYDSDVPKQTKIAIGDEEDAWDERSAAPQTRQMDDCPRRDDEDARWMRQPSLYGLRSIIVEPCADSRVLGGPASGRRKAGLST